MGETTWMGFYRKRACKVKLQEVFERIGCGERDECARRVSNVSHAPAKITADEIESGVSLERLESIGVPVFRYQTQLTIHGTLPDFNPEARPAGYKAVFRNGNGSLGVKYVAIDAAKKARIVQASRLASKDGFHASIDSTGLHVGKFRMEKADCLADLAKLRELTGLFYGGIWAGACVLGGYMSGADIGAIPQSQLLPLITALFGFQSEADIDAAQSKVDAEREAASAAWTVKRDAEQAESEAKQKADIEALRVSLIATGFVNSQPIIPGSFIAIVSNWEGVKAVRYSIAKGSFGRLLYRCANLGNELGHKSKVADKSKIVHWQRLASQQRVFA